MSGSVAKVTIVERDVESLSTLELTESSTSTTAVTPASPSVKGIFKPMESSLHRELPIFSNPLLANATQANSVPSKPKTGRVKSGSKSVPVLRISAPKVDGEVVVMRRLDTDLVNATSMFNAAYPAISEKMNAKESTFITRKYDGYVEKSGPLNGVWITVTQAKELAKEYEIDHFMRPLLEASLGKNGSATEGEEVMEKVVVSEITIVQTTEQQIIEEDERQLLEESQAVEDTAERMEELTIADVAGMKRRIEELEEQVSRNQKRFRGLVTVAVGLAAATVIPQVLPYFP
ncbi:hypothetical protein BC939DRAFT_442844 [Gamsiella multidivaricata]|uniref:uncharacterized protein n=1 Tax=Gamsiella multidivaricata TaxID=101098 RepID=UPI00221F4633|nr:uncharacterized protein BC939DRAFT_442844 [Gamsiella multidivaricata]KAG0356851.1 hypothetical protein BGZ54_000575 [Gamsiella multidivaricata]KAI7828757.1 hypothetical protein BC939DRAFT_442844 [Gamsiella multidivaricata]